MKMDDINNSFFSLPLRRRRHPIPRFICALINVAWSYFASCLLSLCLKAAENEAREKSHHSCTKSRLNAPQLFCHSLFYFVFRCCFCFQSVNKDLCHFWQDKKSFRDFHQVSVSSLAVSTSDFYQLLNITGILRILLVWTSKMNFTVFLVIPWLSENHLLYMEKTPTLVYWDIVLTLLFCSKKNRLSVKISRKCFHEIFVQLISLINLLMYYQLRIFVFLDFKRSTHTTFHRFWKYFSGEWDIIRLPILQKTVMAIMV